MTAQTRPLGFWEEICQFSHDYYLGNGMIAAIAFFTCANPEKQRFASIARQIHMEQPLLRAHIVQNNERHAFTIDDVPTNTPLHWLNYEQSDWQNQFREQLQQRFLKEGYQWRLTLFVSKNSAQHYAILTANHSIADGLAMRFFFNRLFSLYAHDEPLSSHALQPAPDSLTLHLPQKQNLPPANFLPPIIPYQQSAALAERQTSSYFYVCSMQATRQLENFCQQNSISVNALLNALALHLMPQFFDVTAFNMHTPVNIRPYCQPQLPEDYFACVMSIVTTYHQQNHNNSILHCARDYQCQLDSVLPHEAVFTARHWDFNGLKSLARWQQHQNQFTLGPAISNLGRFSSPPTASIAWTDFYFSNCRMSGESPLLISAVTFNDRLFCTFSYTLPLIAEEFAKKFAEAFMQQLNHGIIDNGCALLS